MSIDSSRWHRLRPVTGLLLLAALWWRLEPTVILTEVQSLSMGWAMLALASPLPLPPLLLSAWRAVIIERASGQLAMVLLTLLGVGLSPLWHGVFGEALSRLFSPGWLITAIALVVALSGVVRRLIRRPPAFLAGLRAELHRSLLASSVWPKPMLGSLLVVSSYALAFVCAARVIGVQLPATTLLAPSVLLAMLIPVSVAGWGMREGAAAFC